MLRDVYYNLSAKVEDLQKQVKGLIEKDADAFNLTELWLSQPADNKTGEKELKDAILVASPSARHLVFNRAYQLETPALTRAQRMRRRLPIFDALVEEDKEKRAFHRNRGQLGVALATCDPNDGQDLKRAVDMLTDAMTIRPNIPGRRNYEFYRAYARILQNSPDKDAIRKDLWEAWNNDPLLKTRAGKLHASIAPAEEIHDEYTPEDIETVTKWLQGHDRPLYETWIQAAQGAAAALAASTPQFSPSPLQTVTIVNQPSTRTPSGGGSDEDIWVG
jgi:hypothetical protein